jgi:hypothetical protein
MTQPSGLVELVNTLNFKRIWRNKRLLNAQAFFHLKGEANQWWKWIKQVQRNEGLEIT